MADLIGVTLVPLALLILLGWVVGRWHAIDVKTVTTILIYAITPVVAFGAVGQMSFQGVYVLLPVLTAAMAAVVGLFSYALSRRLLKNHDLRYLLPIATGSGNNGYFGLPLAMAIFQPEQVGVYFLITMGVLIFESTLGYYFIGRGHLTAEEAVRRVLRLPAIYAIAGGVLFSALHLSFAPGFLKLWESARGCYVGLGMMLIGFALAKHRKLAWDGGFVALTLLGKYIVWALLGLGFMWIDPLFPPSVHAMILILALTPCAANTVAYAVQHDFKPEHAATIVLVTTIISFAALPFVLPLLKL